MDAGVKRNVKYISLMQLKALGWLFMFSCVYGLLMAFVNGGDIEELKQTGVRYFSLILLVMPMSIQMRYIKNTAGFVLSMGCTRKNIIVGQHILSLEILAEVTILFIAAKGLLGVEDAYSMTYLCYNMAGVVLMLAAGMIGGLALGKGTTGGLILYIVFMCSFIGIAAFLTGTFMVDTMSSGTVWINVGNNSVIAGVMWVAAIVLYGISVFFTAAKFKKMEVVC